MHRTFLLALQFDGTHFLGWQRQAQGRTVQAELEAALARLTQAPQRCHAAGRTDAGVHALALGVSTTLPDRWTAASLHRALNAVLPRDCRVAAVHGMAEGFHARTCAESRRYRYVIGVDADAQSPFRRPFEWALARPLDAALLAAAAIPVRGRHDFRAFAAVGQPKPHHLCDVREVTWTSEGERRLVLEIEADRFLHHMVRMLVGTMVDIARARRPLADMAALLTRTDNRETSAPAPPEGLYFLRARYPARWYGPDRSPADAR